MLSTSAKGMPSGACASFYPSALDSHRGTGDINLPPSLLLGLLLLPGLL
ncbi:MAG: hypothetical protein QGG56_04735 [Dehalococcoidia bacterium]|nr:hypothetical protein [Dehalococcoidia bacterium]